MFKLSKKQSGFTLIELIIVMVIIGILALLLLPNLSSGPKRARDSQRKSDLRTLQSSLEQYFADNKSYPCCVAGDLTGQLVPTYAKTVPTDPKGGNYTYQAQSGVGNCTTAPCDGYSISATLEYNKDANYPTYTVTAQQQ